MGIQRYGAILLSGLLLLVWGGSARGAEIRDLRELKQDPLAYVDRKAADLPLLPAAEQARLNAASDVLYFAPWHMTAPRHSMEQVTWGFREYGDKPGYGRKGKRHPRDWVRAMALNAHLEDYPQGGFPAVTVKRCDFRVLPTGEPHTNSPQQQGKGYPFDNLQESSVPAGTPILVTQVSRDGKWFLAETSYALGWIPPGDVAEVDGEFMRQWECGRYVVIVKDEVPVRDERQRRLFAASLGSIFPKAGDDERRTWILTAARDNRGKALLRRAWVPKAAAADKPLPLNARQVARLAHELVGDPYGWGGWGGRRDCSSLVRDIFTSFGIWLPRNSKEQAETGRFVSFRDLSSAQKEARIIREGVPWRTLLWKPGHIMLYIGVHQGRPLIFHSFWSVTTLDTEGNRDRFIVGRAAVTTLTPGREPSGSHLPRIAIEGMTFLGEPPGSITTPPETSP